MNDVFRAGGLRILFKAFRRINLNPQHFFYILFALTITPALITGCTSPRPKVAIQVFGYNELVNRVTATLTPIATPTLIATPCRIHLLSAINETVSFQFILQASDKPLIKPTFKVSPPVHEDIHLESSIIEIFRMHEVPLDEFPGWHEKAIAPSSRIRRPMDVLVPIHAPRGGLPEVLQPDTPYTFWVDLHIPKGSFEGQYISIIQLFSDNNLVDLIEVHFEVWPLILPDENVIPFIAELDHRALFYHHIQFQGRPFSPARDDWRNMPVSQEMDTLLNNTLNTLHDHRLTPILPKLSPNVTVNALSEVIIDWTTYDAIVTPMMNGRLYTNRIQTPIWPLPLESVFNKQHTISNTTSSNSMQRSQSQGSNRFRKRYLELCIKHFAEKGWLGRAYALYPGDDPDHPSSADAFIRFAETVRAVEKEIRILSPRFPQDLKPFGWINFPYTNLIPYVDIWSPSAQYFDPALMAELRKQGRKTWMTTDRPPFSGSTSIFAPSTYTRILSWQAHQLGVEALRLGIINDWPKNHIHPTAKDCIDHQPDVLLYPGGVYGLDHPIATVRLKHLRASLQDAAYTTLLKEHGLNHINLAIGKALSPYAGSQAYRTHFADGRKVGWLNQPRLFDVAREFKAEQLMDTAYHKKSKGRAEKFDQSAKWRRLMLSADRLELQVDGCRVRQITSTSDFSTEVECTVTITNLTRTPVSGRLYFSDLPDYIVSERNDRNIPTIAPYDSRRITLHATIAGIPLHPSGNFVWPITLKTPDGDEHQVDARISLISTALFSGAIRLDGDLSDWPLGQYNVASDFQLITAAGSEQPALKTIGFVMRDQNYLYVAINAQTDQHSLNTSSHNNIRYNDLIPENQEMVEILIDPFNSGIRSSSDIYHLAIKSSGVYLAEQGIRFSAPCSDRKPWAADVTLATKRHSDGWTAELKIPFSSLPVNPSQPAIWGFSITRRDAAHQEFSTSCGSTSNAYDSMSLGNLHIPLFIAQD